MKKPEQDSAGNRDERLQLILDRLDKQSVCTYEELAEQLQVSTMTIRRDLERLVQQGAVIKTVGGAQRAQGPSYLYETAVYTRLTMQRAEKRAIARQALDMLAPQSTIFIDGSTTCLELARCIAKEKKGLTIVTHSALVCLELGKGSNNTIIGIGGQYDPNSLCYVGPQAEDMAKGLFIDVAFVGTKAFVPTEGTFESSLPTFRIKQIVAERCNRMVLLVDHSKMGQRALSKVLDITQIHTVVTDDQVLPEDLALLAKAGPKVIIAPRQNSRLERTADVA